MDNEAITKVYGAEHGIKGVLSDRLIDMSQEDAGELELLLYTPSLVDLLHLGDELIHIEVGLRQINQVRPLAHSGGKPGGGGAGKAAVENAVAGLTDKMVGFERCQEGGKYVCKTKLFTNLGDAG